MSLSEFFILTLHGDRIVYRDCMSSSSPSSWSPLVRQEMPRGTPEIFYRAITFSGDEEANPVIVCLHSSSF